MVPCNHEIKRRLLLGRKAMTNLDRILKSSDISLPTKVCIVKKMVFPVVMYGCESWTITKAKHWRTDAFELCWIRLFWVPWTERISSSQSILKEVNPEYSLEGLMLKLEASTFWPPDAMNWLTGKDPFDAGKVWRQEEKGTTEHEMVGWYHQLDRREFEQAPGVGDGQGSLACCSPWGRRVGHNWATEQQQQLRHRYNFKTFVLPIQYSASQLYFVPIFSHKFNFIFILLVFCFCNRRGYGDKQGRGYWRMLFAC